MWTIALSPSPPSPEVYSSQRHWPAPTPTSTAWLSSFPLCMHILFIRYVAQRYFLYIQYLHTILYICFPCSSVGLTLPVTSAPISANNVYDAHACKHPVCAGVVLWVCMQLCIRACVMYFYIQIQNIYHFMKIIFEHLTITYETDSRYICMFFKVSFFHFFFLLDMSSCGFSRFS